MKFLYRIEYILDSEMPVGIVLHRNTWWVANIWDVCRVPERKVRKFVAQNVHVERKPFVRFFSYTQNIQMGWPVEL